MEVARAALAMALSIALPLLWQWLDKRRMSAQMRARTWNFASWGAALYAFGPLSMLGWMWITRPRWRRVLLGAASAAVLLALVELCDVAVAFAVGAAGADDALAPVEALLGALLGGGLVLTLFELFSLARARLARSEG